MSKTILCVPDPHAHPDHDNDRADYLSKLIIDTRPDIVVNLGDQADMSSLSSYDKGKRSFQGKSYKKDIQANQDFNERLWDPVRATKKKMPRRIILEGNHENRIERALDLSPELEGTIGFKDYNFDTYYNEVVRYDGGTPGIIEVEGILFSHFFITGISGRPIGGERPAHMLLAKNGVSCVQGHTHTFDYAVRKNVSGKTLHGLVAGCFHDYAPDWAGNIARLWRAGVILLRNVDNGDFDFQWISLEALRKEYGTPVTGYQPPESWTTLET